MWGRGGTGLTDVPAGGCGAVRELYHVEGRECPGERGLMGGGQTGVRWDSREFLA